MKRLKRLNSFPANIEYVKMASPVGELTIIASDKALYSILWEKECDSEYGQRALSLFKMNKNHHLLLQIQKQLKEYFLGHRKLFDLPLAFTGTDFQNKAWQQLCKIPYGKTISYGEQAEKMGDKNKARAVGMANGMNPISIVVPCHRVIGSNGQLTGFGGGLESKALLLRLEDNH